MPRKRRRLINAPITRVISGRVYPARIQNHRRRRLTAGPGTCRRTTVFNNNNNIIIIRDNNNGNKTSKQSPFWKRLKKGNRIIPSPVHTAYVFRFRKPILFTSLSRVVPLGLWIRPAALPISTVYNNVIIVIIVIITRAYDTMAYWAVIKNHISCAHQQAEISSGV